MRLVRLHFFDDIFSIVSHCMSSNTLFGHHMMLIIHVAYPAAEDTLIRIVYNGITQGRTISNYLKKSIFFVSYHVSVSIFNRFFFVGMFFLK